MDGGWHTDDAGPFECPPGRGGASASTPHGLSESAFFMEFKRFRDECVEPARATRTRVRDSTNPRGIVPDDVRGH